MSSFTSPMLSRLHSSKPCFAIVLAALSVVAWSSARADIFQLKDGGEIVGELIDRGPDGEYVIHSRSGATVTLSRRQVQRTERQDDMDREYARRSRELPDTVNAHRLLAEWCRQQKLSKQADHHLQRILELDPEDEPANLSLGLQRHQGRWLTRDEIMQQRGLKRYKGKHRTPQDITLREQQEEHQTAEADWLGKIRTWRGWLDNSRRVNEAAAKISAIQDPHAARSIVKILEREEDQSVRDLLTETLAELDHPLAVIALVNFSLEDPLPEVRQQCLDLLIARGHPISLTPYVSALDERRNSNEIVNRAAEALMVLKNPAAISPLIDALVTKHKYRNTEAPPGDTNVGFSRSSNGASGGGLSLGGSPKVIIKAQRNMAVRLALVELSGGLDFEFDEKAWRRWYVNEQIQDFVDTRRDQ